MHYYLSSYLLGNQRDYLKKQALKYSKIAYIPNSKDIHGLDINRFKKSNQYNIQELTKLRFTVETLDLKDYFNKQDKLLLDLNNFNGVFVRGGNVFALRQAMKLSGMDKILIDFHKTKKDFFYFGYSAGICVLAPSLKGAEIVDPIDNSLHLTQTGLLWEGLGILDYTFVVHYKSDHPESKDADKELDYYIKNKVLFKALRDGEVLIQD